MWQVVGSMSTWCTPPRPLGRPSMVAIEDVEDAAHERVGAVVVVAVAGGLVEHPLAQRLVALPVVAQGGEQVGERHVAGEHVVLQRRERVGDRADADALDVAGVVAGAAGVVVAARRDAVVDEHGEEHRGHVLGVELLDREVAAMLDRDHALELPRERREHVVEAREPALGQGQLEELGQVEVAREDVGFLAEGARSRRSRCCRPRARRPASCPGAGAGRRPRPR